MKKGNTVSNMMSLILILSRDNDLSKNTNSYEYYTLPFVKKPCEFEGDGFKIMTNILGNRIFHNLTSEKEEWQTLNRGNKSSRLCIAEDIIIHHDKDCN